jgi:hypothetical protein
MLACPQLQAKQLCPQATKPKNVFFGTKVPLLDKE